MSRTKASFSHPPLSDLEGGLARKRRFHIFHFHFSREVSHESLAFTSSTFTFGEESRTKASFSHLPLSDFARKLRFHILNFQIWRGGLARKLRFHFFHCDFGVKSRTKASLSLLPLSLLERSLARKLRFHIFHFDFWSEVSHESLVFTSSTFTFGEESRTKASFSHLLLSVFE